MVVKLTPSHLFSFGRSDIAFIDRADIKMYIGLPSPKAINAILCSGLNELGRAGIIHSMVGRFYSLQIAKTFTLLWPMFCVWPSLTIFSWFDKAPITGAEKSLAVLRAQQPRERQSHIASAGIVWDIRIGSRDEWSCHSQATLPRSCQLFTGKLRGAWFILHLTYFLSSWMLLLTWLNHTLDWRCSGVCFYDGCVSDCVASDGWRWATMQCTAERSTIMTVPIHKINAVVSFFSIFLFVCDWIFNGICLTYETHWGIDLHSASD